MTLQSPWLVNLRSRPADVDALGHEILQERAAALGRATEAFERALSAYLGHAANGGGASAPDRDRELLLQAAGEALFGFVVQREACGLRNTEAVLREYRVPAAVRLRMGVIPGRENRAAGRPHS